MATFETIDYSLRPNKNVERKLIAEALQALSPSFDLTKYRYIGLGGIWFVDFVLFHRTLRIRDMISIQEGERYADRARFNKPYGCIQVRTGVSTTELARLLPADKPVLVWMDYDSMLAGPVLKDIPITCESLKSGDIVLFTVNADHRRQLANQKAKGGVVLDRKVVLSSLLKIPVSRIPDEAVEADGFPPFVATALFGRMKSGTRIASGGALKFVPLFNFKYADGATMITIGGMIVNAADEVRLNDSGLLTRDPITGLRVLPFVTQEEQFAVRVPLLTHREKLVIDRLLPRDEEIPDETLARMHCTLEAAEVDAYRQFYRYYPSFSEMAL
jgi:hypothetical protein